MPARRRWGGISQAPGRETGVGMVRMKRKGRARIHSIGIVANVKNKHVLWDIKVVTTLNTTVCLTFILFFTGGKINMNPRDAHSIEENLAFRISYQQHSEIIRGFFWPFFFFNVQSAEGWCQKVQGLTHLFTRCLKNTLCASIRCGFGNKIRKHPSSPHFWGCGVGSFKHTILKQPGRAESGRWWHHEGKWNLAWEG